jgi:hypothetical protein
MTTDQPGAPKDPLLKSEDLLTKLRAVLEGTSGVIGKHLDVLDGNDPVSTDSKRLSGLVDNLFASADTLIFLAERARAVQLRQERKLGQRATGEMVKPVDSLVIDGTTVELTLDEQSILTILREQEVELSTADLIDLGFGLDVTDNYVKRKSLLTKTLASLISKLSATNTPIIGKGNTRARRYSIEAKSVPVDSDRAITETDDGAVEPTEVIEMPIPVQIDVFAHLRVPEYEDDDEIKRKLYDGVTAAIEQTTQPIIRMSTILTKSFSVLRVPRHTFKRAIVILKSESRLKYIGDSEYLIVGRDENLGWTKNTPLSPTDERVDSDFELKLSQSGIKGSMQPRRRGNSSRR